MNARSPHPAGHASASLHDDIIGGGSPVALGPACCCPANPVVRVVMPATAARPHRTELLLCGHHYRGSRQALATAKATVTELLGSEGGPPDALLPDFPQARTSRCGCGLWPSKTEYADGEPRHGVGSRNGGRAWMLVQDLPA